MLENSLRVEIRVVLLHFGADGILEKKVGRRRALGCVGVFGFTLALLASVGVGRLSGDFSLPFVGRA